MIFDFFSVRDTLKIYMFARIVNIIKRLVHHGGYGNLPLLGRVITGYTFAVRF